jgi:broad specificity phosphatase PhoE
MSSTIQPFYMVRHGETDWNRDRRFQGQIDIPLNPLGRLQAAGNGRCLRNIRNNWADWRFVSSPLGRTRVTMQILRQELKLPPDGFDIDDRLIEVTFGEWERKRLADLAIEFPDEVANRGRNKWEFVPPGGESYAQAVDRVSDFLNDVSGPSVIVCHGGIIRATRFLLENTDAEEIANTEVPQDQIYAFDGKRTKWIS